MSCTIAQFEFTITKKFGEEEKVSNENLASGTFAVETKKGNVNTVNVDKIQQVTVLEDTHFDTPKDLDKNSYMDVVDVICEIDASR